MACEKFQHKPLERGHVRLAALQPGHNESDPITLQVFHYPLETAPLYEALSYAWGGRHMSREVSVGGLTVLVTANAYIALQELRHSRESRMLWIDALCINQYDQEEIYDQMTKLADIYVNAERVLVYLGPSTAATDISMDYLIQNQKDMGDLQPTLEDGDMRLDGFRDMLSRPWFERSWTVQDVFYAQAAIVQCGSKVVPAPAFARTAALLKPESPVSGFLELMERSGEQAQARAKFQLYDMLRMFRYAKATDPLDRVYALLGMVDDTAPNARITQDHSITETELIRKVIASMFYCEVACIPELPYNSIDKFLSNFDRQIDKHILEVVLESSQEIDLKSLLRYGKSYVKLERSHVDIAARNKFKGSEMVELLLGEIQ
ncbi:heterokaryon incompatibility protein-domain-containing protein [Xylariales sp. PMI_506]|nr:heterokaryon incompatibility protein-domain-containing protein [Xylariales sp. PMI_506]